MIYATADDLEQAAEFYGVSIPADTPSRERLLALASRDIARYLGADWDPLLLEPEQIAALRDATCAQAVFRSGQGGEFFIGLDDGVASVGGLTFSTRTPPRLSVEAAELVAGLGLYARSGTVEPDPLDDAA